MSDRLVAVRRRLRAATLACAATFLAASAGAVENGALRIAPGWAGGELVLPLLPGTYGTVGVMHYEATRLKDNAGNTPEVPVAAGVSARVGLNTRVTAVIPRVVWISEQRLLGGYLGAAGLIPYLDQKRTFSLAGQFAPGTPAPMAGAVQGMLDAQAGAMGGSSAAWGDLELAPVLSWPGDRTSVVFIAAVILPTGSYDRAAAVNAGAGNYRTFRPTFSYGYTGDGWDAGLRAAVAFNSRNKDTDVKSGTYLENDFSLLKHFGSLRAGVQGYLLRQFAKDSGPGVAADGNKSRASALGPALSWSSEDAAWIVDAKWLREFGVRNRPEGRALWLSVNRSF
ncbi:MAG: SphA family protein [Ramlibacter sp.]